MPGLPPDMRAALLLALLAVSGTALAETVYVIDRVVVGLRAEPTEGAPAVKSVDTGTALEVLERHDTLVHVREPQGAEGWIDARYVSAQAPVRAMVPALQAEVGRLRAQLAKLQAQPGDAPSAAALQKLETELNSTRTLLAQAQAQLKDARREPAAQAPVEPHETSSGFSFGWLLLGFAMLGLGFVVGVVWVRESIRRRMGGMYLRI